MGAGIVQLNVFFLFLALIFAITGIGTNQWGCGNIFKCANGSPGGDASSGVKVSGSRDKIKLPVAILAVFATVFLLIVFILCLVICCGAGGTICYVASLILLVLAAIMFLVVLALWGHAQKNALASYLLLVIVCFICWQIIFLIIVQWQAA